MVNLSTCLILSTVFLLTQVSYLTEAKTCCPGDTTCSGCWMCPNSELRTCWDAAVAEIDQSHITDDYQESANTFCKGFAKLAICWRNGRCCSEYAPLLAAATNLCNLKTWSPHLIVKDELEKFVQIANQTRSQIWHNDSGKDVPILSVSVEPYKTDSSPSNFYHLQSTSHTANSNKYTKSTDTSDSSDKKFAENNEGDIQLNQEADLNSYHSKKKTTVPKGIHQPESEVKPEAEHLPQRKGYTKKYLKSVHHQAKSGSKPKKCQTTTEQHYRTSRSSYPHRSLSKRVEKPLHKRAPSHQDGTKILDLNSDAAINCGLDFHQVAYPKEVPETVAHIFNEL